MNTQVRWRVAGIALLVGWFGALLAFQSSGSPGGSYQPADAAAYTDPGGYFRPIVCWTAVALCTLALPFFGYALRGIGGWAGEIIWALSVAATAVGVTGAYFAGGFIVSLAESGGTTVHDGTSGTLTYTFAEMGNLLATTAPSFLIGAAGLVLAWKGGLPIWLRVITVIGGLRDGRAVVLPDPRRGVVGVVLRSLGDHPRQSASATVAAAGVAGMSCSASKS